MCLTRSLELLAHCAAEQDVAAWEDNRRDFHTQLVHHAGRRLTSMLPELYDFGERYRRLYVRSQPRPWSIGIAEHGAIVEECRNRDALLAAHELARHLSSYVQVNAGGGWGSPSHNCSRYTRQGAPDAAAVVTAAGSLSV